MDVIALVSLSRDDKDEHGEVAAATAPAVSDSPVSTPEARSGSPGLPVASGRDSGTAGRFPAAARQAVESLGDDHLALLEHCRPGPLSVADLAAEADLPLGVVRVLLADLLELGQVRVTRPVPPAELPDIGLLQHLITGLRSL